jgi:hypothetical protein
MIAPAAARLTAPVAALLVAIERFAALVYVNGSAATA